MTLFSREVPDEDENELRVVVSKQNAVVVLRDRNRNVSQACHVPDDMWCIDDAVEKDAVITFIRSVLTSALKEYNESQS